MPSDGQADVAGTAAPTGGAAAALSGVRVVEWAEGFGAPLCARLLADLGAEVIKLEPRGGDWTRAAGLFFALNFNKRALAVDLDSTTDRQLLCELLAGADVLIENHPPGWLARHGFGADELQRLQPELIVTSLTPFGQSGPHRDWQGEDLIGIHAGGLGMMVPDWVPGPEHPPLRPAPRQAEAHAAIDGTIATLAAILGRDHSLAPAGVQRIDVSTQECVASILHTSLPEFLALGRVRNRFQPTMVFSGFTAANDGLVRMVGVTEQQWHALGQLIGASELLRGTDRRARARNRMTIEDAGAAWATGKTRSEIYHTAQALRLPFAPVLSPSEVLQERQLLERRAFVSFDQPGIGRVTLPGAPFRSTVSPWRLRRAAPLIDEHRAELVAEREDRLTRAGAFGQRATPVRTEPYLPLTGVRVADFSWAWAGPHCAAQFADLGAEVIKVESRTRMDTSRSVGPYPPGQPVDLDKSLRFTMFNRGKAGITLNLRDAEALALAHELVGTSDIVVENFAPGVMDRLGLGYAHLSAVRPDIVMLSLSGFGNTGPERGHVAYGYTIEAYSGLAALTGAPGSGPTPMGLPYADPTGGLMGVVAVLAALLYRDQTGRGQHIDLSETEALLTCLVEGFAVLASTGSDPERVGNEDRYWAPHGVYPCRDGRWLALSIVDDDQWQALVAELGAPAWATDAALAERRARHARRAELNAALAAWSAPQQVDQLAQRLQAAGVPAAPVRNAEHLLEDAHLVARGFFQQIDHPGMGYQPVHSAPFRFGADPLPIRRAAPLVGQDNAAILGQLLGHSPADLAAAEARGALQ